MEQQEPAILREHDNRVLPWCRELGQPISFNYCRRMRENLPCSRIVDCWHSIFDVQSFLVKHFSEKQLQRPTRLGRMDRILNTLAQESQNKNREEE